MPYRKIEFAPGEYYHLCNRSNDKKNIFLHESDYVRFLLTLLLSQNQKSVKKISRKISGIDKLGGQHPVLDKEDDEKIVEVSTFAIMPNHFHILVKESVDKGVIKYMQKIQNSYAKYFNTKYEKSGHLFQGPFRAVHIENNDQLLYTSAYIHRNPREIKGWKNKERSYPYSSYQDYVQNNRWGNLIQPKIILDQFESAKAYRDFVEMSGAKNNEEKFNFYILNPLD